MTLRSLTTVDFYLKEYIVLVPEHILKTMTSYTYLLWVFAREQTQPVEQNVSAHLVSHIPA